MLQRPQQKLNKAKIEHLLSPCWHLSGRGIFFVRGICRAQGFWSFQGVAAGSPKEFQERPPGTTFLCEKTVSARRQAALSLFASEARRQAKSRLFFQFKSCPCTFPVPGGKSLEVFFRCLAIQQRRATYKKIAPGACCAAKYHEKQKGILPRIRQGKMPFRLCAGFSLQA